MAGEIRQVKDEVNIIFEKVLSSNASQIENFVLVTFNDPTAQVRTKTRNRDEFKRQVAAIRVHGGADCPEFALTGIELALKESLPLSYVYVFTDASAKDHNRFDQIKSISQKKQSQVVFVLTGECGPRSGADYQVYHKVAKATNGQVFHMMKDDVKDILKYIEESITSRGNVVVNEYFKPGYNNKIKYTVDSHTGDVLISVTGERPKVEIRGPGGSKPTTEPIVSKSGILIVKVTNSTLGDYEVEVGSASETHVVVNAKSDLNFQLGFSVYRPNSMKDTVTRPAPEGNAFLGIRLLGSGVKFTTAKILDMSGNVITELPLQLKDEKTQFYTSSSFSPPFTMFRVAVSGYDVATKSPIARTSPTPLERQNPSTETKENRAPQITIDDSPTITTEYDAPLQLKCNVHGYPVPDITWEEKDTGIRMPAEVQVREVPYDYVSIMDIDKANKNVTYQCKASNIVGVNIKYIQVQTKRKIYFDVTESPKDITVEYNKEGSLVCKVDSYPPASITWYKDGTEVSEDSNIDISSDKSILTIKYMQVDLQGTYTCEAKNDFDRKVFIAKVAIFGVEKPVIDKSRKVVRVIENTNTALSCRILKGIPKPKISWSFQPAGEGTFRVMVETSETIQVNNVGQDRFGLYTCNANNDLGSDSHTTELVVEYPPKIKKDIDYVQEDGEEVIISCDVTGEPAPAVKWFFNDTRLDSSAKRRISSDHSLNFEVTPADMGYYTCEAQNKHGRVKKTVFLNVWEKPAIDKSNEEINVVQKTNVDLFCRILQGNPEPTIRWYYRPPGSTTFIATTESSKTLRLYNVGKDKTGSYKCTATNSVGQDKFTMELVVQYPPTIKENLKEITSKDDDEVRISCDATGEPTPAVRWFFNNTIFDSTAKRRIAADQSLRFKARLVDIGYYRCEAANKLGSAKKTTFLNVYIPVKIETPKSSTIEVMVGKSQILNCRADGYPKPNIKWTFQGLDPMIPAADITPTAGVAALLLKNMQLDQQGSYTCEAENGIGGSAKITYDVKVYAPPVINNLYPTKAFEALAGDPAIKIQCKATGSPKPSIVWTKNGLNLAIDSDWYDMEDDGTLVIKNIERDSEGTYVCLAQNILGNDTEAYEVIVRDSLVPDITPTNTVFIPEGETKDINCGIPHKSTDQIRWYKVGAVIAAEELTLYSVTRSDDGLYTCRISDGTKAYTATTKVVIGFKPVFTTEEDDTIDFVQGADPQFLSCEAYGEPRPTTAIWKHNGKELETTSMSYPLGMEYGATGTYECEVSNDFGSIHRTFTVTSRACILDIKTDFPEKQPVMFSRSIGWPEFHKEDGYMVIPPQDYFFFNCPSQFSNPDLPLNTNLMAFCERDNTIKIYGKKYKFADIQCIEEVKPEVEETGFKCGPGNTEIIKIGYKVLGVFIGVYEVCLDRDNNVPLFAKHRISPHHTDRSTEAEWSNSVLPHNFDSLYDCRRQVYDISSALGRGLSTRDSCCFGKRQLVNSRDLLPGVPTSAAYEYLNVIPHWSTCNSKNWEDVEQSVRKLVTTAGRDLVITTGTANPRRAGSSTDIKLDDGLGRKQPVAPYLWKVVQDHAEQASIAIIQVNIPELSAAEAPGHVLCADICAELSDWMDSSNFHNVADGYTYCCSIIEFEKAFDYNKRFSTYTNRVLYYGNRILAGSDAKK